MPKPTPSGVEDLRDVAYRELTWAFFGVLSDPVRYTAATGMRDKVDDAVGRVPGRLVEEVRRRAQRMRPC
jgi:hypothetical protein